MKYPDAAIYSSGGLVWNECDPWVDVRVQEVCDKWEGTPYMAGQQSHQQGVDCVRFVCAALDELHGVENDVPREVQDVSLHDPERSASIVQMCREFYPGNQVLGRGDLLVEPGDVILTGHRQGGPGHAILVGGRPNTLFQALKRGVRQSGMGVLAHYQTIFSIIRPDKSEW